MGVDAKINIVYACGDCNTVKSCNMPAEFLAFIKGMIERGRCLRGYTKEMMLAVAINTQTLVKYVEKHGSRLYRESQEIPGKNGKFPTVREINKMARRIIDYDHFKRKRSG
jgi:hypothetical protein